MKITKLGHCCMLIEEGDVRLLTDPGSFTADRHKKIKDLDAILFTHEHADHFHMDSLKQLLESNPDVRVICNSSVGELLMHETIKHEVVADKASIDVGGVSIEGCGTDHAVIHSSVPVASNTGFFIGGRLWYPGDAFPEFKKYAEVIALPTAGPWMKASDAIDYALARKPKKVFPVHDFILSDIGQHVNTLIIGGILTQNNIEYMSVELGKEFEI